MPESIDILIERLKQFDEVTLLELLDITAEDIVNRFKDKISSRRNQLFGEIELFDIDDPEIDEEDEFDGFQVSGFDDTVDYSDEEGIA